MIVWRVLPLRPRASLGEPGGALWFPRELQGAGRHDDPDRYGCLYVSESPVSAVAEALAPFRGTGALATSMLVRGGERLGMARLELRLERGEELLDLDDPRVLSAVGLRPSQVATGPRERTQAWAARLFEERPPVVGLRWWSTIEASLANLTLYDRAHARLGLDTLKPLAPAHPAVREAADLLGLLHGL